MTDIDEETLKHIENLAKISIPTQLRDKTSGRFNKILSMVQVMSKVDTAETAPMAHPHDVNQPFRRDLPDSDIDLKAIQANALNIENDHYIVPAVLESGDDE